MKIVLHHEHIRLRRILPHKLEGQIYASFKTSCLNTLFTATATGNHELPQGHEVEWNAHCNIDENSASLKKIGTKRADECVLSV